MEIIKKPFRFLKNVMRWYEREADNIIKQVRKEIITPALWKKAEDNFHKRGMPVPIYENHKEDEVVGMVEDIEAREDGLYVIAHRLFDKGKYLVEKEEYPLPSGDFVLHYDEYGNIADLEIFGVSLVNSEGAKDVEPVTMNKATSPHERDEHEEYSINKVIKPSNSGGNKKNNTKGVNPMEKEEVLEFLNDDDFLKNLPADILEKIAAVKKAKDEAILEEEEEVEEKKANKTEDGEDKEEATHAKSGQTPSKTPEEVKAIIDEVIQSMKDAGLSEEAIAKATDKLNSLIATEKEASTQNKEKEDEEAEEKKEAKKANKEEEGEEKKEAKKCTKEDEDGEDDAKDEKASMSKFEDMIAKHEALTGARVVPSSVTPAKKLLKSVRALMGKKAYRIAFNELQFIGGRTVEKATMSKNADRKTGTIVKDIMSY